MGDVVVAQPFSATEKVPVGRVMIFDNPATPEQPELLYDDELDPRGILPDGPAFSIDDVIEFHYLLEDDRRIQEFLANSGGV